MDCLCCERDKNIKVKKNYINLKKKEIKIKERIDNKDICCSYILCEKKGVYPLEKQACIKNIYYYFCSNECWEDWINFYSLERNAVSPDLNASSLEYMKHFRKEILEINTIPPLFI